MGDIDNSRYVFKVEWFDNLSAMVRSFLLFYFVEDNTVEIYDVLYKKTFLRRTNVSGINKKDMFIGSTISIFSRSFSLVDFGNKYTEKILGKTKQRVLLMLKPDVISNMGKILRRIQSEGFIIVQMKMVKLLKEEAMELCAKHHGKPFLPSLIEYITSGPCLALVLVAENGFERLKKMVGGNPEDDRRDSPDTLRALYGADQLYDGFTCSSSIERVETKIQFFFPTRNSNHKSPSSTAQLKNCTCGIIKPCAVNDGFIGDILQMIQDAGFKITALEMFFLDKANAEEFYEIYKTVVPEYPSMVDHLVSGACVALEITTDDGDVVNKFRELAGPIDPDIGKMLKPNTLRARFGRNKIQNAIHCTDLEEDGLLEVEYFFKLLSS